MEEEIKKTPPKKISGLWELVRFAILALLIVIPIRAFIAQPFIVRGDSMVPTFENDQYLIVDEISYRFSNPQRGYVIVFRYPKDQKKFFIKRIIGLPGETIRINGGVVIIKNSEFPDGFNLPEPYIKDKGNNELEFVLKEEEYFVMGDNRNASSDSRYWGSLPQKLIVGKAFLRLLPINNIDIMPGDFNLDVSSIKEETVN